MNHPSPDSTLDTLGQEFVDAFFRCVYGAQDDLEELILYRPKWASTYTQRFKANFLHERIWARLLPTIQADPRITAQDREPFRTLHLGMELSIRIKRHSEDDQISTYRTPGAVEFYGLREQETLDGTWPLGLALGYRWDRDIDQVLAIVASLQDLENRQVVWAVELVSQETEGEKTISYREMHEPQPPGIEIRDQLRLDLGIEEQEQA